MIELIISDVTDSATYRAIACELQKSGHTVHFTLIAGKANPFTNWLLASGYDVSHRVLKNRLSLVIHWFGIRRYLFTSPPQVIICLGQIATLVGLSAALGLQSSWRIYVRQHSTTHHETGSYRGQFYDRLSNRFADHIVATNQNVLQSLCDAEGVSRDQVTVVHLGIDLSDFGNPDEPRVIEVAKRWGIDRSKTTIGMVARLTEIKGWPYLIDHLVAELQESPHLQLVIANAVGDLREDVQSALVAVRNQVIFIEYEHDVAALYATFDVFVHIPVSPTVEAFGLVYLEAFAAGIPAVITMSGIAHEIATNEVNCLVVPHKDGVATMSAINRLLLSASERQHLSAAARQAVSQFDITDMAVAYSDLFISWSKRRNKTH
jgi:glycosyltransferase involved in cell wall biosynthesis